MNQYDNCCISHRDVQRALLCLENKKHIVIVDITMRCGCVCLSCERCVFALLFAVLPGLHCLVLAVMVSVLHSVFYPGLVSL